MFEQMFQREKAITQHTQAPLCDERKRYLQHLQNQGAARSTLKHHARHLVPIVELLCKTWPGAVTESRIQVAASKWVRRGYHAPMKGKTARRKFVLVARAWFRFFGKLDNEVSIPYGQQLHEFVEHMRVERNLSPFTIRTRRTLVEELLRWIHANKLTLAKVDPVILDHFLAEKVKRCNLQRVSIRSCVFSLRSFIAYAEQRGWCRRGMVTSIEPPRVYHEATPPAGPSWSCVVQILKQQRGTDATEIRDRAIILLFAIYGFRTSEVRRFSLDDIDWKAQRILLYRSKSSRCTQVYPLAQSVRDALVRYIKDVRPRSQRREIFLQLCSPYRPLSNGAFWQIVRKRLRAAAPELKHHGPHALRHACATRLLHSGFDMKKIGDFLGHRDARSTAIYAKVDLPELRLVADVDLGMFI